MVTCDFCVNFSEWKEKEDLEDDVNEDTVEFSFKNTFIFDEMMTMPLTGDEIIVMPHLAMIVSCIFFFLPKIVKTLSMSTLLYYKI